MLGRFINDKSTAAFLDTQSPAHEAGELSIDDHDTLKNHKNGK